MANKLRDLDKLKDEFVSSVSHELRSPLSAISGYVELASQPPPQGHRSEAGRTRLSRSSRESTLRLTEFVNDILDLAKLKAEPVRAATGAGGSRDLAEDVIALLQPLFDKKQIAAVVAVPAGMGQISIDEEKIRQVLTNLVANALKFTPLKGKITISSEKSG